VLLHTLGITQETLLAKQAQYLDFLRKASQGDLRVAFQFLSYIDRTDLAEKLLMEGISSVLATLRSLVKQEYARMINKRDEQRCRILIPQSRLLFGVCDPTAKDGSSGRLQEGECFLRITHDGDGLARTIINTEVLVTRNPCLHPGDLQKFKAVDVPEFAHLTDCIVFSTKGHRPSADLMSGGDLDGDKCESHNLQLAVCVSLIYTSLCYVGSRYHPIDNGRTCTISRWQRVDHFWRSDG
jgi:hypothetical protein